VKSFWWQAGLLAIIWTLIYGEISIPQIVVGFLFSAIFLSLFRDYYDTAKRSAPTRVAKRAWYVLIYLFIFFKDLLFANIDVTARILRPRLHIHPGIVAVHIPTESDIETTLVGSSITLTPGELVIDIDPEKRIFYIHCIDARKPDDIRAERLLRFEKYQARIFR